MTVERKQILHPESRLHQKSAVVKRSFLGLHNVLNILGLAPTVYSLTKQREKKKDQGIT